MPALSPSGLLVISYVLRPVFGAPVLDTFVDSPQYSLVVDAGSSGSRLRMYNKTEDGVEEIKPHEEDEDSFETEPGLSSYAGNPDDAGPSLTALLQAAAKYVPESYRSTTPLWIKATAGMRLVPEEQLGGMFTSLDQYLSETVSVNPFKYMGSEVLGGEEEAVFAWISMNFILGTIFQGYTKTSGILDMGGASMQVAFNPGKDIMSNEFSFYVNEKRMSVYAKSFIKFGLATAVQRAMVAAAKQAGAGKTEVVYPCYNKGYNESAEIDGKQVSFVGSGDPTACDAIVQGLLHLEYECLLEPCALMGVHMPKVIKSKTYYAIANFFYIANGLDLIGWSESKSLSPSAILEKAKSFCQMPLADAEAASAAPWKYKKNHCFGGLYMFHILTAYGFADDADNIVFARKLDGKTADWSMGAALFETQYMPVHLMTRQVGPGGNKDCAAPEAEERAAAGAVALAWALLVAPALALLVLLAAFARRRRSQGARGHDAGPLMEEGVRADAAE
ncbi:unnamed protein product [Prorocentrum cordatum]|uniref:Apyrase n=1 Tax=Prorocentrum cordatum TaxID=2364126 RepID=A0ABN9YEG4_9DINO|nr:unnamed protein product [Polarella glacialis]